MARWLEIFTASDLAGALHTNQTIALKGLLALQAHQLVTDTGGEIDGPDGPETVWEMHPLPDEIVNRLRRMPPEVAAVIETGGVLAPKRGMPVRLVDRGEQGTAMSTSGARRKFKDRERAYKRMQEAIEERAKKEKARRRARAEGKAIPST